MISLLLILIPLAAAPLLFACGGRVKCVRGMLLAVAALHLLGTGYLNFHPACGMFADGRYLGADGLSRLIAAVISVLFFCVAAHAQFWLPAARRFEGGEDGKSLMKENLFAAILCCFLSTMTLAAFARNFGLLWIAVEATTLASAPLICFHRSAGSLEATWKYLLICSVGIGFALFGTMLLGTAVGFHSGGDVDLSFNALTNPAARAAIHPVWYKAAFLFCLAGYGLKMGLAPFHTWLPDAHSEAPSMVSVLLSGALLNCSFLAIVRVLSVAPDDVAAVCRNYLAAFGLFSLLVAAVFIVRQHDYKRLLAYSSVEHMGLIALFWGLGETGLAMIHLGAHSLSKMLLFLVAGNFLLACGTRRIDRVRGMFARLPWNSTLWIVGILLICGAPPSPLFFTEFLLIAQSDWRLGAAVLALLLVVFAGMTQAMLKMTMGEPSEPISDDACAAAEKLSRIPALLTLLIVGLGMVLLDKLLRVTL